MSAPVAPRRHLHIASTRFGGAAVRLALPALVIGAGAGLAAVVFRWLIEHATLVFSGHADYSAVTGHPANPWVPWLGAGFVVLAPAVGGLLYGPLIQRFAPEARGHGVPEVMFAIARNGGRIRGSVAVVKALASAICIGAGGSVGREGPIIQIGSALGSTIGRWMRMPEVRLRTLVACGAAGGISATFNAPVAGVFFALELLLRDFTPTSFGAVAIASVTAALIGRAAFGDTAFLHLPSIGAVTPPEYLLFAALGLLAGMIGIGFTRVLYLVEDACDLMWAASRGPEWLRPVVGGVVLGALLLALPQLYGVGYPVLERGVAGQYAIGFLAVLVVGKVLATSLTLGIGGSGGVFAPSLFVGAMAGAGFGEVVAMIDPAMRGQVGAFAVVGMAAVFAGSTRAPITAGIMLFELTGDTALLLPIVVAVVIATAVSKVLSRDTIYTLKLSRRGVDLTDSAGAAPSLADATAGGSARALGPVLSSGASAAQALEVLEDHDGDPVVLVDTDGAFVGVVSARSVGDAVLGDQDFASRPATDVVADVRAVPTTALLRDVVPEVVGATETSGLPVVDGSGRPVGWLGPADALRALVPSTT
ncbi:chloride channel protein [Curtobacterium herbarum]|uniref:Chloride channel protein n=1 Tax=Curtobacterium herbarum TaxID=150122 RepID=A0ABN1ZG16_9MICO|nr:chloride channel protein [Curtobacterium herbarum]MBM7474431.1 CIC family chloride channel protein [Curtobacterium herbarum]MCS6545816.1 chloride channel protein [Curtobacterium herbarum]